MFLDMAERHTTSEEFFDKLYSADADPWNFAGSDYELSRYASEINFLEGRHFKRGFEPGCSIGVLTEKLAPLCDRLEAIDISPTAASLAREHCSHLKNVTVQQGSLPQDLPSETFDLIVFSEIGYYFKAPVLEKLGRELVNRLEVEGVFLAAHWLGHSPDHVLSGDRVHQVLGCLTGLRLKASERHPGFRIDRWSKT
jgi:SAM-dependent methyltransferase